MEITDLSEYKGDTWKLELDGADVYYVNMSVVADFCLQKGMELDEDVLSEIRGADNLRKAKKRALYLLSVREYCEGELYKKLLQSYDEDTAREASAAMREYGYVNDEDYAPRLAAMLIHNKHMGLKKARYELLRRGLDENLVEDVLSEYSEDDIDEEITSLLEKKYYNKIDDRDDRRRTIAALMRRGYDYYAVKRCIDALCDETDDDGGYENEYGDDYYGEE